MRSKQMEILKTLWITEFWKEVFLQILIKIGPSAVAEHACSCGLMIKDNINTPHGILTTICCRPAQSSRIPYLMKQPMMFRGNSLAQYLPFNPQKIIFMCIHAFLCLYKPSLTKRNAKEILPAINSSYHSNMTEIGSARANFRSGPVHSLRAGHYKAASDPAPKRMLCIASRNGLAVIKTFL